VPGDIRRLGSRNNLASAHKPAGQLEQAIPLSEQMLTDRERALGADHLADARLAEQP